MTDLSSAQFETSVYNHLQTIDTVDAALRESRRFDAFLGDASRLFTAYQVPTIFGVCLLHRHFACTEGELPIEKEEDLGSLQALITRPIVPKVDGYEPTTWQLLGNAFVPLEFSMHQALPPGTSGATEGISEAFLQQFKSLLDSYGYSNLVGFCVADRTFYRRASTNQIPVEGTDTPARANIVTIVDDKAAGDVIETCWQFPLGTPTLSCPRVCKKYCYNVIEHKPGHYNIHQAAG